MSGLLLFGGPISMAPQQIATFNEQKHPFGMNEDASENSIPEGFVEDLRNGYPSGDKIVKRKGYQGKGGPIPIKIQSLTTDATRNKVYLTLPTNLNLSHINNNPVVITGTVSVDGVPFFSTITSSSF